MRRLSTSLCAVGVLGSLFAFSSAAAAPDRAAQGADALAASAPAPKHFEFDDELVDAERASGNGDLVTVRRGARRSPLIVVRRSFIAELIKSADDI